MIAYEELAAALERWRIRNGLPGTPPLFADSARRAPAAAPAAYAAPPAAAAYAPAPAYAPPVAPPAYAPPAAAAPVPAPYVPRTAPPMPPPPSSETLDEELGDFAEADVLDDEAHLDTEGPDFSMPFPGAAKPDAALSADDERESSLMGGTDPGIVAPAAPWPDEPSAGRSAATLADDDGDEDNKTIVGDR